MDADMDAGEWHPQMSPKGHVKAIQILGITLE